MAFLKAAAHLKARKKAARTEKVVKAARAKGAPHFKDYKAPRPDAMTHDLGHTMGYKHVAAYAEGPKHTRHAIHRMLGKMRAGSGEAESTPFYTGYARGARKAADDYMQHIYERKGKTKTFRKLSYLRDKL